MPEWIFLDGARRRIGCYVSKMGAALDAVWNRADGAHPHIEHFLCRVPVAARRESRLFEPAARVDDLIAKAEAVEVLDYNLAWLQFAADCRHPGGDEMLFEVRVHWPAMAAELALAGFNPANEKRRLRDRIAARILADLRGGGITPEALLAIDRDALSATYGGSPSTADRARDEALARFDASG
jgi:hypothetical protein